jgi:NitT/TauT family transport system substrate-binding protein
MFPEFNKKSCAILFIAIGLLLSACQNGDAEPEINYRGLTEVRLGLPMQPMSALAIIALEKGFFTRAGLNVVVTQYPSGKRALEQGLFKDAVDYAIVAETPFALNVASHKDLRVLTGIFYSDNVNRIIARNDRGIVLPADLRNKKIATQRASAVDFFMYQFMLDNHVDINALKIEYFKIEELVGELVEGRVDALSLREPYISEAKEKLNNQVVVFEESGIYSQLGLLVSKTYVIQNRTGAAEKLLQALALAGRYAEMHGDNAVKIVARYMNADSDDIARIWEESEVRLQLNQSFISITEDVSRWAIQQKLTAGHSGVPNFLKTVYPDALLSESPESINLLIPQ